MMARTKWDDLLPSVATGSLSRGELGQELARIASAASIDSHGSIGVSATLSSAIHDPTRDFTEQVSSLTRQMTSLATIQQTLVGATQDNTQALTQNTVTKSGSA